MSDAEEWRAVVGWEGLYEVSSLGRVRSLRRGRFLAPAIEGRGYLTVSLYRDGRGRTQKLHRIIAKAFIPNPDGLPFVRHLNDISTDNRLENLAWGNASSNGFDAVRNGVHPESSKTHCPAGHEYTPENTAIRNRARVCRECERAWARAKKDKSIPSGDSRHGTANGYLNFRCRCADCVSAYSVFNAARRARAREKVAA